MKPDYISPDGRIKLYNADCMDYMEALKPNAFELAVVDPPYGIDINSSGRLGHYGGKGKSWDLVTPKQDYFLSLYGKAGNQIVWGANYFEMPPSRGFLIWDKQQPEGVSFASCEFAWSSFDRSAKTYYQRPQSADSVRIHPTQKPVKLYDWIYKNYAKEGDRILDTHLGSGSSAIAAHYAGLEFVGIELDEDYFKAAVERFEKETAQGDMFGKGAA